MALQSAEVVADLVARVDPERLLQTTMALVEIASPSGQERAVAERYAELLSNNGLRVDLDSEFPESPTVIARLRGAGQGRTLQLEGHTDTVAQPHAPPVTRDGRIYGRGAADMKAGLAAMAEAVRVLGAAGRPLQGDLLLTAHGQHEDPVAPHELHAPLFALFRKGIVGDAAIIAEGPSHQMVLAGKGLCVFELSLERDGEPVHEIPWRDEVANPILGGQRVLELLAEREREWRARPDPLLGPETFFVGVFEAGDYFNRIPTRCRLVGSRRYPPERSYDEVINDLRELARQVESETGLRAVLETRPSGQGFRVAPSEPIVQAVSRAYHQVVGHDLPQAGMSLIANASQFNTIAHVPTVYHGVDQTTAHSGLEHVALSDVVRTARVLIASAVEFSGLGS
jgi:acetylornithine deacetylase/succinyl-diaminopimelate desuccinylase-like protein